MRLAIVALVCGGAIAWTIALTSTGSDPSDYGY